MYRSISIRLLAAAILLGLPSAAQLTCPCDPAAPPYPGMPMVKDSWMNLKGGTWDLTCTNASSTGDFVWTYTPAMGVPKVLARCIFVGGQNRTSVVRGDDGNIAYFIHSCLDGGADDGQPWDMIVNVFCKANCTRIRMCLNNVGGTWVEDVTERRITTALDFSLLPTADIDGDSVSDAGFNDLTTDLYPFPPPPLPAEFEARVRLLAINNGLTTDIVWETTETRPSLSLGDAICIDGLVPSDILFVDSAFSVVASTDGVSLVATMDTVPTSDQLVARVSVSGAMQARYVIEEVGADDFWNQVFANPAQSLNDFVTLTSPIMADLPGNSGATVTLNLGSGGAAVPAVPIWGLAGLTALVLGAGGFLLRRRH